MKKETVTMFDLQAAFKALDDIDTPVVKGPGLKANRVDLKERLSAKPAHEVLVEDYYDVNSPEELGEAQEDREAEVAKAKLARIEKIVDLDAESEDDILPSYVGKYIMQCPQCMTLFYKAEEDIEKSEETPDVVNINEICQHCGNSSGYTLVGKVGGIDESEAENFDLGEMPAAEGEEELNLDFPAEGTEEVDAEGTGEGAEEMAAEDDFDLDLDLDLEDETEEPEEANESLNNSKLLDKIEDKNDLKTDIESEHLTLNEDLDEEEIMEEDLADVARKVFDRPASVATQQRWEDELNDDSISPARRKHLERKFAQQRDWETRHPDKVPSVPTLQPVNSEIEEPVVVGESVHNSELLAKIEDKNDLKTNIESKHLTLQEEKSEDLYDELWGKPQPTEEETRANLANLGENVNTTVDEDFEELDDDFDNHVTEYLKEVYSNIKSYSSTNCTTSGKKLVIEGIIKFQSGKEKTTRFTFDASRRINNKLVFRGMNEGLTSEKSAFRLACKTDNKKLIMESLSYSYNIEGVKVKGKTIN
jgi:hypothetical protein